MIRLYWSGNPTSTKEDIQIREKGVILRPFSFPRVFTRPDGIKPVQVTG